jgi:hypothetical protein
VPFVKLLYEAPVVTRKRKLYISSRHGSVSLHCGADVIVGACKDGRREVRVYVRAGVAHNKWP